MNGRPPGPFVFGPVAAGCLFIILVVGAVVAIQVGLAAAAFERLGLSGWQGVLILGACLVGGKVDIPVWKTRRLVRAGRVNRTFTLGGLRMTSMEDGGGELVNQTIAVNLGGCVIPGFVSAWLVVGQGATPGLVLACVVVTVAAYLMARPTPGVGFKVPALGPPLATALAAYLLSQDGNGPQLAYVAGTVGTLLGTDIFHLASPSSRAATDTAILSIGGAGTFLAVILCNVIAVLLV